MSNAASACAPGDVLRVEQAAQAGPQRFMRQPPRQYGGDHALARRQRRHLRCQNSARRSACNSAGGLPRIHPIKAQRARPDGCSGGNAQASTCSNVVLPDPEGPITASCSPA